MKRWMVDNLAQWDRGLCLERLKKTLGLDDKFEARVHWGRYILDWCTWGHAHEADGADGSLPILRRMVEETTRRMARAPDKVYAVDNSGYTPTLTAEWNLDVIDRRPSGREEEIKLTVQLRIMSPAGCKIDPRKKGAPAVSSAIHPECGDVLTEIQDRAEELIS